MAEQVKFEIISPAKLEASGQADMIIVPGVEGDLGLQAGRMPIMLMLRSAVVYIFNGTHVAQRYFVKNGYAQFENNIARVLCEETFSMDNVNTETVNTRLSAAQKQLHDAKDDTDKMIAHAEVEAAEGLVYAFNHPSYS